MLQHNLANYLYKISNNLNELLEINSMSILELANKTGISYSSLHNLVNKRQNPTLETLLAVCSALNINLAQLSGETPLFKSNYSREIKEIPLIEWHEVVDYLKNKITISQKNSLIISYGCHISDSCFALKSHKLKLFTDNSILMFDKIIKEVIHYDNNIVLISTEEGTLSLRRLIIDGKKNFLEDLGQNLPIRELLPTELILSYLFQVRIDY